VVGGSPLVAKLRPPLPPAAHTPPTSPLARQQCTATDLAPVTITYSPVSGGTAGTAPFLPGSTTTVGTFERFCTFTARVTGWVLQACRPADHLPLQASASPPPCLNAPCPLFAGHLQRHRLVGQRRDRLVHGARPGTPAPP
jgi:hypothetical protein